MSESKLVLTVKPANLRQNHLYIDRHYDFFPPECFGPNRKKVADHDHKIKIYLDGLNETVHTDIGTDRKTGKPRNFFRERKWVRRFFEFHRIDAGAKLALERLGEREYRLSIERMSGGTNGSKPTRPNTWSLSLNRKPRG